jgi:hypothetical protein
MKKMGYEEIGELVAVKVMGWYKHTPEGFNYTVWVDAEDVWHGFIEDFMPSEDIGDAWKVVDTLCKKHNWRAILDRNNNQTEVNFKNQMGANLQHYGIAETAPMAICFAALGSVGIEVNAHDIEDGQS